MGVLYHGADYNPDQWLDRPDILEQDIDFMKKAGVSCVSLGIFAWATLEPEEGKYNLDWMEEIIEKLYAAGVSVDLATPSGARPAWMAQKYPEVRRVNADRVRQLFGERHNHCYTSPVYREKVCAINQMLASRFGRHPAVIMWHISNEYGGDCHCELCQQAFRDWLKAKYGTIEAVNKAWNAKFWSHEYNSFDQIESPAPHGEHSVHGLKLDWKRFVSYQTTDFMKWERDCIREIVPEAKVCVNMMYHFDGVDYFEQAKEIDLASWDSYPTWHKPGEALWETALDTALMHDLYYSVKKQPFWLMESTPSYTNWQRVSKPKRPGVQLLTSLQAIAHGSDSVMYFQWRQSQGASEKFHGAVVSHDCREDNRVFRETCDVGAALKKMAEVAGTKKEKSAAIVMDWSNKWALEDCQGPRNIGMGFWEEMQRHYNGLAYNQVSVDFVHPSEDLSGYKLVVCPLMYMMSEEFTLKLREYVKNGGTLVVTYWSGVANETDLVWLNDSPHNLTDVLGVRRLEVDGMFPGETRACRAVEGGLPETAQGSILCEVAALEGAKPLMVYDEEFYAGAPAVSVNEFGEGRAYYVATRFDKDFYKALYETVCRDVVRPVFDGETEEGVLATKRGEYVFLQNFCDHDAKAGEMTLKKYETVVLKETEDGIERIF